ncbi:PAS domain S-box-containing protein/diguanylate cyclase (GGDEF) domain-containing protein [Streptosporangium subroseum]|uniref:PAS domain S-box-containing protein/diguanylate cyclase (GGDEF) domain-containing protein n=1 Tax=Streptosporangium subroseum TaxID=106412 RepID=A0A239HBN7_9ACTN|nr:GGDEF domain-containing protein [Streptosporangium subroseum]SNS78770.1 PAS domain S-box-containing protein/diguanylate cyclase (GGDEF) domain-containing protein [Streptosporangium subroseum]
MIRWRDPRVPLTAAAGIGAVGLVAAFVSGASAVVVGAVAGFIAATTAAISLFTAATRVADRRRAMAWRWLAGGSLTWLVGIGVRPLADGTPFVVTFADLMLLVGTAMIAVGTALCATRPAYGHALLRDLADGYVCAASVFVITWVLLLAPVYGEAGDAGDFAVTFASPLFCLILTCVVGPAVVPIRRSAWPVGLAALAVLAAITIAEMATALTRVSDAAPSLTWVWLAPAAFLLLAAVPWSDRTARVADSEEGDDEPGTLSVRESTSSLIASVPLLLVVVATGVVLFRVIEGRMQGPVQVLAAVSASIVGLLAVRLFLMLVETGRMRRLVDLGERQLHDLAESTGDVVLMCDYDGVVREIGEGVETTYGYRPEDLIGGKIFDYIHPEDVPGIQVALRAMSLDEEPAPGPGTCMVACRVRASDGTWRPTESVATRHVRGEELLLITTRDISDQEALRNQVAHLTFHDGVTGLPNRAYFEERTREVLVRPGASSAVVVFLDLDGFTAVNDSVGHASGDYLLGQAARRLRATVRADDTLARWGGDEFAVLLESAVDAQTAVDLAERLVRTVSSEPFRVADRDIALTASVGVAFADDDVSSADLIRNADVAMARAKELGGRRVEVFAAHMHADVVRRLELAADLQRALLENQFAIEYQPVVDLATSRVTAVEALVRWVRGGTFVPPEQFLGPAEDTGLIVPLSEWILREACREVAAWRTSSWDIGLSLNLSSRQIMAPRFVETVESALTESGLPPSALTLEVIEEMLVEDAEETITRLSELRRLGVRLAIDDFGTGYASLALLRQLPVDMIKIDPSFVSGLGGDETLTLLTRTIVRLGHDLGLIVVAEGIERPEQLELLREMGCTRGQGFLVARPMAARGVDALMCTSLSSLHSGV